MCYIKNPIINPRKYRQIIPKLSPDECTDYHKLALLKHNRK